MINEQHNSENDFDAQNRKFDNWCDMWADAQDKGLFDDAPHTPELNRQTSRESFFGPQDTNPSEGPSDTDAQYWQNVNQMIDGEKPELLQEGKLQKYKRGRGFPPNPMYSYSQGKDQDLAPRQLGITFDEEDVEELADMKRELHDLESQISTNDVNGKNTKQLESRMDSLKKRIDELSTSMGRTFPLHVEKNP
jgi:hypothetical protein